MTHHPATLATFCVVTRVPTLRADDTITGGNLAAAAVYREVEPPLDTNDFMGGYEAVPEAMLTLRTDVFALGEILVLGPDDREIGGAGRKPSKWDVEVYETSDLAEAIAKSREVTDR